MFGRLAVLLLLCISYANCAMQATANLMLDGTNMTIGTLSFMQSDANSPVVITGTLSNLNMSSNHGFHVHTNAVSDTFPNCTAANGHFNPYNRTHGARTNNITSRHVGDLGNLTTNASGKAMINLSDSIIQFFNSTQSIAGRTIIVHRMFDDGGQGMQMSTTTGNAGARVACGVIKMMSDGFHTKPSGSVLLLSLIVAFAMVFQRK